ncbi:uncharacterized protein PAC_09731 [Phialocephala subalpina]|uniref:Zn(2)-C6 fungal-type domain-containing protein n=1 Tax=Phialocephala subalpina TaxID=576137 RepID=A0A1L7X4B4_9HELO|nr:uncharacterized protein PAC_09731 [Phialocephala subalpina]
MLITFDKISRPQKAPSNNERKRHSTSPDLDISGYITSTCLECTRRKVKCDKQVPCSRCRRAGVECTRERVLISHAIAKHRSELSFLRQLKEKLHTSQVTVNDLANEISKRISSLEAGNPGAIEILPDSARQDKKAPGTILPAGVPVNEASRTSNDTSDKAPEYAATVTLESLAWGRYYGGCYPHRRCNCYSYRSSSEMISIGSDPKSPASSLPNPSNQARAFTSDAVLLPSIPDSVKLVNFHVSHLAWHHGILHTPTFLEQCGVYWSTITYRHPLWMALYLSVLSSTTWSVQNSERLRDALGISVAEHVPRQLFEAMVETLYFEKFLEAVSMYSVQAIVLSTEVAHNLGFSDLNASLLASAIRLSQCMGLHKITEPSLSEINGSEQWHEAIEREVGKRVWCQIVIQDHFGLCFTDSYNINPKHCLTELPKNCDDYDLEELSENVPTITSYIRTLAKIAKLVPRLFDELGPLWSRKPVREQYQDVIKGDRDMRSLVGDIPSFLLREDIADQMIDKPWLDIARRSLAITAAEKLLYPEDESNHGRQDKVPLVGNQRKYHDLVNNARERLASRQGDIIAKRGVRLIDKMLSVGGLTGHDHTPAFMSIKQNSRRGSTSGVRMDLQTIVAQFLAGDAVQMGASEET